MNIYIGYKYTRIKDKDELKGQLKRISSKLNSLGHETFLLGRDFHKWKNHSQQSIGVLKKIITEIKKADKILIFVNSQVPSMGLFFEFHCAKLLGKPITLLINKNINANYYRKLANKTFEIENFDNLENQLPSII